MTAYRQVPDAEAREHPCSKCGAEAGAPCTRVQVHTSRGPVTYPSMYADNPIGRELSTVHRARRDTARAAVALAASLELAKLMADEETATNKNP